MFKWYRKKQRVVLGGRIVVGWREWCELPALQLPKMKVKIDTGARTSALHAFNIEPFTQDNTRMVRFDVHPLQDNDDVVVHCEAALIDQRVITSSNGEKELRCVIKTPCHIGKRAWNIELTLTNRSSMRFRMLLGRKAMKRHAVVDPGSSFLQGQGVITI